jgi:thiol-disulfide isomerase/thioredoxin
MTQEPTPRRGFRMTRGRWIDLAWIVGLVLLWQTGGLAWVQAQVLRLVAPAPAVAEAPAEALPDAAWSWRLRALDGRFVTLADFRGQPLFVNRWATWCGPCRAELPSIRRLHESYGPDLAVVLISDENPDELVDWLQRNGYADLPVYRATQPAPGPFATRSIPASWLIDPEGRVVAEHTGAARWDAGAVRDAVAAMLP